jgi:hypothetical protein
MAGESTSELKEIYEGIRAEAKQLAGGPYDVPQRAAVLHAIYLDSGRNHVFPQVALHGALWAYGFFAVTGLPGRLISYRYFYDREERAHRSQMLHQFSVGFQKANRAVFVDTYANYYLTKHHGERTGADELVKTELLEALNRLHYAARSGKLLGRRERGDLYEKALLWEQEKTVGPRVRQEIESFDCPILTSLVLSGPRCTSTTSLACATSSSRTSGTPRSGSRRPSLAMNWPRSTAGIRSSIL